MNINHGTFPSLVKEVRSHLGLSQEELAHELGVSFSTVNHRVNSQTRPIKIALRQFVSFCEDKIQEGTLRLEEENE